MQKSSNISSNNLLIHLTRVDFFCIFANDFAGMTSVFCGLITKNIIV